MLHYWSIWTSSTSLKERTYHGTNSSPFVFWSCYWLFRCSINHIQIASMFGLKYLKIAVTVHYPKETFVVFSLSLNALLYNYTWTYKFTAQIDEREDLLSVSQVKVRWRQVCKVSSDMYGTLRFFHVFTLFRTKTLFFRLF